MRKVQQVKILELLQTLKEANDELKKRASWDVSRNLLAEMQDFAFQIGQYIESVAGEGTKTVVLLEEFCATIYEAYQNQSVEKYIKWLKSQLRNVENSVRSELRPNKIEVVFFPYQLSMWDSLESVYMAAKADPACDVYVVPIPWFDKKTNGEFGEMHYDGDQYPKHISITNWQEYDVEARHPDVIYIHNCYDEGNYVTSVHPDFYSKRLREYTDLLVYIPYFVGSDNVSEDFCTTAACVYAHKTIVQSEKIREIYIRAFNKTFGKQFGNPKDKFVALGSPKFDAVINAKLEDFTLPEKWSKLIYNADGTKKKIVLYNTSVAAILQWNEQHLKKLRSVLNTFKGLDDFVLWWRPHPLSKATYQSMRPHLLDEFENLIAEYMGDGVSDISADESLGKKQGRGNFIFDQSSNLHRAIAMSSCYYGDASSSLVVLYKATGKPIMLQNTNFILSEFAEDDFQEYRHSDVINFGTCVISIEDFKNEYPDFHEYWLSYRNKFVQSHSVHISDYQYGTSSFFNAVYKTDFNKARADFLMSVPSEDISAWLYYPPCRIGNKLLFVPHRSRKWAFYNLDDKEWSYQDIPKPFYPSKDWRGAFAGMILFGDSLIVAPGESGAIAKYNLHSGEITYHTKWFEQLRKKIMNVDWGILSGLLIYNDTLLLISAHTNLVLQMDPKTMEVVKTYTVGSDVCGFRTACLIPNSDTVYFIKFRKPVSENVKTETALYWTETILKWNIKTGTTKELTNLPIGAVDEATQNLLGTLIFWRDVLYITPLQGDSILKLDIATDEITRLPLTPKFDFFQRKSAHYEGWAKNQALPYITFSGEKMKFVAQLPYDYSLAEIDFETGEITNRRKWYVEGIEDLCRQKGKTTWDWLVENQNYTMINFLDDVNADRQTIIKVSEADCNGNLSVNADGYAGQKIYDYTKGLLC